MAIYSQTLGGDNTISSYKNVVPVTADVVAPGPIETDFNNAAIRNNPQMKQYWVPCLHWVVLAKPAISVLR